MADAATTPFPESGCPDRLRNCVWPALLLLLAWSSAAQQQRDGTHPEGKWEVLENCGLATNAPMDGDSFQVTLKGRAYLFRLYFVDAPETDPTFIERLQDQAAYFGISTNDIPRAGDLAGRFTRGTLSERPFTVVTRWQNALGRSSLARFYCIVLVDGKNLAEELVARGLARIHGYRANWPDGPRSSRFINTLKNRELEAREKKLGVWDDRLFSRSNSISVATAQPAGPGSTPEVAGKRAIDLNDASFEELQKLPGIGRTLALRIIAHRPYRNVDDLEKVPGIGSKTLERLRPLVRVPETAP